MPSNTQSSGHSVLALSRVSARYEDNKKLVLRDISISIPEGAFLSLIGPSGAGKSTLLRIILGLMKADEGEIIRNFKRPGMVFQNYALFPWLTALENVAFGPKQRGTKRLEREKIAREKLKEVGLEDLESHYPAQLSGGQRQRVGLARALAISPDLLIMDEPFSNLDTITAEELKKDLLKIWREYGMTILMVNHLIPDAVELSDDILIMSAHPGEIKHTMHVDLSRPRDPRSHQFFQRVDELTEQIRKIS